MRRSMTFAVLVGVLGSAASFALQRVAAQDACAALDDTSGPNRLWIEDTTAFPGETGVEIAVRLDNSVAIYGFQVTVTSQDPESPDSPPLAFRGVNRDDAAAADAEFSGYYVFGRGDRSLSWAVAFEASEPITFADSIPPGDGHLLGRVTVDVLATVATTAAIRFQDCQGLPTYRNVLVGDRASELSRDNGLLATTAGELRIAYPFRRGDADCSGCVDLGDVQAIAAFLDGSVAEPCCLDAADANDSGAVEVGDIALITAWLASGTTLSAPLPPGPDACGLDPPGTHLGCAGWTVEQCEATCVRGRQVPGDCNQDGTLDISDLLCYTEPLHIDGSVPFPCGDGGAQDPGNLLLLDANGDFTIDLSDVIWLAGFLFGTCGQPPCPPHEFGAACKTVVGCPDVCG